MFEFGPFLLDEPGRILRLAQREISLQPRVFDLLSYLIRNRSRVVSKDELLDALWPDVTVTENSLQRAVSTLRAILREGGMEQAVRNFPSKGYRFCLEPENVQTDVVNAAAAGTNSHELDAADQAVAEQRWTDAVALYGNLDRLKKLDGHHLDQWSTALQCLGRQPEAIPVLVRAVARYTQEGQSNQAAVCAVALSAIHIERNEVAVAKGWLGRAKDLAEESGSTAIGRVLWLKSRIAVFDGEIQQAFEHADAAYKFGRSNGDVRTEALGLMYRGFYRLTLGDTRGGLSDQDHAAAIALSNDVDPITGGVLYCNILWACRTFGDWARASQWTTGYQQLCTDSQMEFSGSCQLHRAEVLGVHGSLNEALAHIKDAIARLSDEAPWSLGDAHRVLGDIHAAIGDHEAALRAYERCHALGWSPEPGYAMLLLERGDPEAAYAALERSLVGQNWWTFQRQGVLLSHLAIVAAHTGRFERAQGLIDELAGQGERWPMPSIRALTNEASAILARERGEVNEALRHWQLARQLWTSVDSRLNAARLRVEIAALQCSLGDKNGAAIEVRAALAAAEELQSKGLIQKCRKIQANLG